MSEVVRPAPGWFTAMKVYRDPRLWFIFLLGCSSGYPWVLISSAMTGWLKDADLSRAAISYFGSVTAVYAINFLWAPLLDRVRLPYLYPRLGQRRSWILLLQLWIVVFTVGIALTNPAASLLWTSLLALAIAAAAASMDVAIDGYRIDIIGQDPLKLPTAAAMGVAGWWTGYSLPGYLAFHYADRVGWSAIYFGLALLLAILALGTLWVREPESNRDLLQLKAAERYQNSLTHPMLLWLQVTVFEPFAEFVRRNGLKVSVLLILFILTFKLGESFLGRMSIQFYREVGFSNEQIAEYSKLIGWGATVFFTLLGSLLNTRFGVFKGLVIGGLAMAASNLMFAWLANVGPDEQLLFWTIILDNFTTAFSIVAFVSFLSAFTGVAFSASQYALLASVGNFGRTSMASFGGSLVDWLDGNWSLFFLLTSLMVIPALGLLWYIMHLLKQRGQQI
jgi:PAT family beta-lactamase induction signal transducer AmpG